MCSILFQIGEETRHHIEMIDDKIIETSLFADQYKKTLSVLNDRFAFMEKSMAEYENNPLNNIISFIGDRGSGKTSCMMSIAGLLNRGLNGRLKNSYSDLSKYSFYCIDLIDPAFFDDNHNVIELFLANLLRSYQKEKRERRNYFDHKNTDSKILEYFSLAQKTMAEMIENPVSPFDEVESLQRLSAGVRLGENVRQLVDEFIRYVELQNGVLVLPIDDIDLNSSMAAEMLEQIRKYLIHPNIIILLSVKLDQLAMTKRLRIQKEYEALSKDIIDSKDVVGVFDDMVEAYLTKTLPHNQRIYMPDGTSYFSRQIKIIGRNGEVVESFDTVREMVLELIYRKTRYLFYNYDSRTSFIVPDNLRQLSHLVGLLYSMNDYWIKDNVSHRENNQYNKLLFRKYLFENWTSENLTLEMQHSVKDLLRVQDASQINATVLSILNRFFNEKLNSSSSGREAYDPEIKLILDPLNKNYNIALGDVLDVMDDLEDSETDIVKLRFLFLLRSYYSIKLYQTYDSITEELPKYDLVAETNMSDMKLTEYDKLIAGYFINSRLSRLVPAMANRGSRSYRIIDYSVIQSLMEEVLNEKENVDLDKLRLLEFFLLSISRRYDTKDSSTEVQYRKDNAVFYAESLHKIQKNAFFDVGALLYNMTRIEECYKRFRRGDDVYELALKKDGSLLKSLQNRTIIRQYDKIYDTIIEYDESSWRSWSCFRNAEIIRAFKANMSSMKSSGGNHASVLAKAFKHMSTFSICIYDRDDEGDFCEVDFKFLSEIADILESKSIQKLFQAIFDSPEERGLYSPEYLDIKMLLNGAKMVNNKVETRKNKIHENYPVIRNFYWFIVDDVFSPYDMYITRDELHSALTRIDEILDQYRS